VDVERKCLWILLTGTVAVLEQKGTELPLQGVHLGLPSTSHGWRACWQRAAATLNAFFKSQEPDWSDVKYICSICFLETISIPMARVQALEAPPSRKAANSRVLHGPGTEAVRRVLLLKGRRVFVAHNPMRCYRGGEVLGSQIKVSGRGRLTSRTLRG